MRDLVRDSVRDLGHVELSWRLAVRGWAKKQEGRNFWVAAFSKTLLI
jgi:hypothetical protein